MDYRGKKVLVTGADGFIGSHLVERLVAGGAAVTALSLYNAFDHHGWLDEVPRVTRERVTTVRGDVRSDGFIRSIVDGHDLVFHLAALISIPHSYVDARSYLDVNISGTLNVLEASRACGVERVIHTSTSEVYGTAQYVPIDENHPLQGQSPYSATKIAADKLAEAYARSFDLPVAILRPFNTFGPRQSERAVISSVIRQCLDPQCERIRVGDLTPVRDFSYVSDTVEAFVSLAAAEKLEFGTVYNAGSGLAVSIADVVEAIQRLCRTDKPREVESARIRPERSEVRALIANARRLTALTGWRPQVDLEDGLLKTILWWRTRTEDSRARPLHHYL